MIKINLDTCNSSAYVKITKDKGTIRSTNTFSNSNTYSACKILIQVQKSQYISAFGGLVRENGNVCNSSTVLRINDKPEFTQKNNIYEKSDIKFELSILYCSSIKNKQVCEMSILCDQSFNHDITPMILSKGNELYLKLEGYGELTNFWLNFESKTVNHLKEIIDYNATGSVPGSYGPMQHCLCVKYEDIVSLIVANPYLLPVRANEYGLGTFVRLYSRQGHHCIGINDTDSV